MSSFSPDKTFKCSSGCSVKVIGPVCVEQALTSHAIPGICTRMSLFLWKEESVLYKQEPHVVGGERQFTHKTQQRAGKKPWKVWSRAHVVLLSFPLCVEYLCLCSNKQCHFQCVRSLFL